MRIINGLLEYKPFDTRVTITLAQIIFLRKTQAQVFLLSIMSKWALSLQLARKETSNIYQQWFRELYAKDCKTKLNTRGINFQGLPV